MADTRVVSITRGVDGEYAVVFETTAGLRREYAFTVSGTDIPVVTWREDFAAAVGPDIRSAAVVYAALQAMHRAFTTAVDLDLSA